jgi:hypothetical protein
MPMTDAERINQLAGQIAEGRHELNKVNERLDRLEQLLLKLTATEPAPPPPMQKPRPGWQLPGPAAEHTGQHYGGEPTPCETVATGESWAKKHPDGSFSYPGQGGRRFDSDGRDVSAGHAEPRPIGPQRSAEHDLAVRILEGDYGPAPHDEE